MTDEHSAKPSVGPRAFRELGTSRELALGVGPVPLHELPAHAGCFFRSSIRSILSVDLQEFSLLHMGVGSVRCYYILSWRQ